MLTVEKRRWRVPVENSQVAQEWRCHGYAPIMEYQDSSNVCSRPFSRPSDVVLVIIEGALCLRTEGDHLYNLTPGDQVFIPSNIQYSTENIAKTQTKWLFAYRMGTSRTIGNVTRHHGLTQLKVSVLLAVLDMVQRPDPELHMAVADQKHKTTRKIGTSEPVWNESFVFSVASSSKMEFIMFNAEYEVGRGVLDLDVKMELELVKNRNRLEIWQPLTNSSKRRVGRVSVLLEGEFTTEKVYESRAQPVIQYVEQYVTLSDKSLFYEVKPESTQPTPSVAFDTVITHTRPDSPSYRITDEGQRSPKRLQSRPKQTGTPTLGIEVRSRPDERGYGVYVIIHSILPGGPAAQAGLFPEDIILSWWNARVSGEDHLLKLVQDAEIGQTIMLGILRNETQYEVPVVVGAFQPILHVELPQEIAVPSLE